MEQSHLLAQMAIDILDFINLYDLLDSQMIKQGT